MSRAVCFLLLATWATWVLLPWLCVLTALVYGSLGLSCVALALCDRLLPNHVQSTKPLSSKKDGRRPSGPSASTSDERASPA